MESYERILNKSGCDLTYIINSQFSLCLENRMSVAMIKKKKWKGEENMLKPTAKISIHFLDFRNL